MKIILLFLNLILLVACNQTEEAKTLPKVQKGTQSAPPFVELLKGQWKTEGNEGVVAKWLEFDSSTTNFYVWLDKESRPEIASGSFTLIEDSIIDFLYVEFNTHQQFKINLIHNNTLDILAKGISTGNLVYKKTKYLEKKTKKTENDTLPIVGILRSVQESYILGSVYLAIIDDNSKTHFYDYYDISDGGINTVANYIGKKVIVNFEIKETLEEQYLHINNKSTPSENEVKTQPNSNSSIQGTLIIHEDDKSGDLPSNYRIVDNKGDTTSISAFIYDDHIALNGKNVTVYFNKSETYLATSITPFEKEKSNNIFIGKWRKEDSTNSIDPTNFEVKKENDSSYALKFSNEDFYVLSNNSSKTLKGNSMSGKFVIRIISEYPLVISYSDDGRDGHFKPNRNIRFVKVK